MGNKGI